MNIQVIQQLIYQIENLPLDLLVRYPQLEQMLPSLYELLQQEDICSHNFIKGKCICGAIDTTTLSY